MRNTGRESALQNQQRKTAQADRRSAAMKADRVAWFRRRKSI
jgi:hypothetical protein